MPSARAVSASDQPRATTRVGSSSTVTSPKAGLTVTGKARDAPPPDPAPPPVAAFPPESSPEPQLVTTRAAASRAVPRRASRDDMGCSSVRVRRPRTARPGRRPGPRSGTGRSAGRRRRSARRRPVWRGAVDDLLHGLRVRLGGERVGLLLRGGVAEQDGAMAPTRPVTVVTGAGRGIGAATAVHLARAGHDVVVGCREDAASAARVVAAVRAAGARAVAVAGGVTHPGGVQPPVAPGGPPRA